LSRRWVRVGRAGAGKKGLLLWGVELASPGVQICVGGGIVMFFMGIVEWWAREQR
jgi:hypothetical protein